MSDIAVCPDCHTINRLGTPPAGQLPACGKCGNTLPWLHDTSDQDFNAALDAAVPVLVDFWAPWCGPCKIVAPVLEQLAVEQRGKLKIVKLNVDENQQTAGRFQVRSIPTLILFKDGEPQETIIGALQKPALLQKLTPHL